MPPDLDEIPFSQLAGGMDHSTSVIEMMDRTEVAPGEQRLRIPHMMDTVCERVNLASIVSVE